MSSTTPPRRRRVKWIVGLGIGSFLLGRGLLGVAGVVSVQRPEIEIFLGGVVIAVSAILRISQRMEAEKQD